MLVSTNTLPSLAEFNNFESMFRAYVKETAWKAVFSAKLSRRRLEDTHEAWLDDIARISDREPKLIEGLDHFKHCAFLTYWLRRMAPVIDFVDVSAPIEGPDGLYPDEVKMRGLLYPYGTEYLALDFGFQICSWYEAERKDRKAPFVSRKPSMSYLVDVCHMMKFKHVSPHSMYLIYTSLLLPH